MISTLAAADLGWVHHGLMVNVRPDKNKLRARAPSIVARLAAVDEAAALAALAEAQNDAPVAVAARASVADCEGDLSRILTRLGGAEANVNSSAGM